MILFQMLHLIKADEIVDDGKDSKSGRRMNLQFGT
jgi:hypothetical protein